MKTVKEFLSEEELADVRKNHEQMFYESFMYDGLIYDTALKAIEECCGEDGLKKIARGYARKEFDRTIDMTVEEYIDYYGDNDTTVASKWEKYLNDVEKFAEDYLNIFQLTDGTPANFKTFVVISI
ncbi:hypothetical protein ACWN8V_07095 [Vagococcus elongatus]|uniref:Uncharacterized protein n=1 Tax=Vagococcus elongatus TaxID=180344 RepID=A0A430AW74_9ENTE|nr:hypothetical protein [Vagococcus elongatus]RSU12298.1 hypothetical protein CBF29_06770 [Vagococcus elongatus]